MARTDGLVVFVPRTAAGDRVVARVTSKGRMGRGVVERFERPSVDRVAPACQHYERDRCGGCQLQHLSLGAQREAKRAIIRDAMRRIGRRDVPLPELRGGDRVWRYRRKLTLALRREGEVWRAGLHAYDHPGRVFSLDDCPIADERLVAIWKQILGAQAHFPDAAELRGSARLLDQRAALVIEGGGAWPGHAAFFAAVPSLAALWWTPERGARRLLHDRRERAVPGASFVQVNPEMAERLAVFIVDAVMAHAPVTVVDAYAGAGDVAAALAARGVQVTAIERDAEASRWTASRLTGASRAVQARVEDALAAALPADVVLLNPPRTGVDVRVTTLLASPTTPVKAIVYVSCDPATLARDVARLAGWSIARLTAFDLFPQTAHVETVCELVPVEPT